MKSNHVDTTPTPNKYAYRCTSKPTHLRKGLGLGVVLVGVAGDAMALEEAHGDAQRPLLDLPFLGE
jgi:hypothetical protein